MKIELKRIARRPSYTIGKLYIDGLYVCDTLEDTDRGLSSDMSLSDIRRIKVYEKTAIPTGEYEVTLKVKSPKFSQKSQYDFCGGYLPRLLRVPGWEGVLIHIGNNEDHTGGCLLVGENKVVGKVINSTKTFTKLYAILKEASDRGEKITIKVC